MHYFALLLLASICRCSIANISPTEQYPNQAILSDDKFILYWKFTDSDITFEIHARTTGWVGIGFSPNGGMGGSDIVVGWVKNGKVKITDRYATTNGFPRKDPKQNVDVIEGRECGGWTMIKFTRQLAACEAEYDREITSGTQRLIWAYSKKDPSRGDILPKDYHGDGEFRGVKSLYMLDTQITEEPDDSGEYKSLNLLAGDYTPPPQDTTYNCKVFKVPDLDTKHHIIKFEPIVQEKNRHKIHHIVIYHCSDLIAKFYRGPVNNDCYDYSSRELALCGTTLVVWAVGGEAFNMPKNAGFSIGSTGDPKYLRMEIHYDNPEKRSDIVDNSGIRLVYTSKLRQHDVGVLSLGMTFESFFIPPHAESFQTVGFCSGSCVKEKLDSAGVDYLTVFGAMLHSHLAGRKLRLRHIRNGTELKYISNDESYNFDYQQMRHVYPPVQILPNDDLQMECVYDTKDRKNITLGAYGTYEEMCLGFLLYYPRINFAYCSSSVNYVQTYKYLGIEKFKESSSIAAGYDVKNTIVQSPESIKGKSVYDVLSEHKWNETEVDRLSTALQTFHQLHQCVSIIRSLAEVKFITLPKISKVYEEPRLKCTRLPRSMSRSTKAGYCGI